MSKRSHNLTPEESEFLFSKIEKNIEVIESKKTDNMITKPRKNHGSE